MIIKDCLEKMSIRDFLEMMDGCGLILTDNDEISEKLSSKGFSIEDEITITKGKGE